MRHTAILVALACAIACDDDGTSSDRVLLGVWSSPDANLVVTTTDATLQLRDGTCYGSYGSLPVTLRQGDFLVEGTFTQLMGVEPGHVDYAATFTGTATGTHIVITMSVPPLTRTVGPLTLNPATVTGLSACLYP